MHQLCSACQHLATLHHLQGVALRAGKATGSGITVHINKRSIQFRQFSDATHIHLAAQRQNTCRGIGNGRLQRQRASVLHQNTAGSRRGQRVLHPLGSNFQRSIRQAHRSDAQRRSRSGHHSATLYRGTTGVIILCVDTQRSCSLLGEEHTARQLTPDRAVAIPDVILLAVHQHTARYNIPHQRHRSCPLITKYHLHTILIGIVHLFLFPVKRSAIPQAILSFVRPRRNQ